MKISAEIRDEIIQMNISMFKAYVKGDIDGFSEYWADNIIIHGTAKGESFTDKETAKRFYQQTLDQIVDVITIEHKNTSVTGFEGYWILNEELCFYFKDGEGLNLLYGHPARLISVWSKIHNDFKMTHVHCSFPDINTTEGEQFNIQYFKEENARLKFAIEERTAELNQSLKNLITTQQQLIQSEKMASLGELTAGIAHEIQNPLNFVNNFSEVNRELIEELRGELHHVKMQYITSQQVDLNNLQEAEGILNDLESNQQKINHHGKRADAIVKGMLAHSRSSSGTKELTDLNALAEEYLRLSYHGLKAKDQTLQAAYSFKPDRSLPKVNVVPQDIGRVLLNLINNAFYAVQERVKRETADVRSETADVRSETADVRSETADVRSETANVKDAPSHVSPFTSHYQPMVTVSTKNLGDKVEISIKDNGNGIPEAIQDKIFQPFFTTKPTGQGTGLGLSLSYDIVKAHGGSFSVESEFGQFTRFVILLPKQPSSIV